MVVVQGTTLVATRASNGTLTDDTVANNGVITLKYAGMYYLDSGFNVEASKVAADAEPKQVYSYRVNTAAAGADVPDYETVDTWCLVPRIAVEATAEAVAVTTVTYKKVVIHVPLDHDGDAAMDVASGTVEKNYEVTAKIPDANNYKHIHYGVWAALGDPVKAGTQELSDLGIGFVQSIGDGLTGADMPNNGTGDYSGNWAGAVQAADDDGNGAISLTNGDATLTANFSKATIKATLTGLVTLEGAIDTNTFSGTKATLADDPVGGLTPAAKFAGSFSGGFYGKQAAEAGGVFDFTSDDAEDGAFRGAFGGNRTDN